MEIVFGEKLKNAIKEAFLFADNTIFIVSPYMTEVFFEKTEDMSMIISGFMELNALEEDARYIIITDLSQECSASFLQKLKKVYEPNLFLFNLPNLHSKMYLFSDLAFIGSFNLTHKGISINHELGVFVNNEEKILNKLREYSGFLIRKAQPINENAKLLIKNIQMKGTNNLEIYWKIRTYLDKIGYDPDKGERGDGKPLI